MVRRYARAIAPLLLALAAVSTADAATRQCEHPLITWTPSAVALTLATGTTSTTSVSFSASCPFTNAVISVNRGLAGFLQVAPTAIASVPAQKPQTIQLIFTIPANAVVGTVQGRLSIRRAGDDDTFVATLPLQLQISQQPPVSGLGATVGVPPGFQSNIASAPLGGPISLNNFANAYLEGGLLPPRGATITISSIPLPPPPLGDLIGKEQRGVTVTATGTATVSGVSCTTVSYSASIGPFATTNISVYCPTLAHLYTLRLSYRTGDPNARQLENSFVQAQSTAQFTP